MRAANTYRGAKRNEAKRMGLRWRFLDILNVGGTRMVHDIPFRHQNKPATKESVDAAYRSFIDAAPSPARDDGSRYNGAELRRLVIERGVGPVSRIHPDVRANFKPTKRNA